MEMELLRRKTESDKKALLICYSYIMTVLVLTKLVIMPEILDFLLKIGFAPIIRFTVLSDGVSMVLPLEGENRVKDPYILDKLTEKTAQKYNLLFVLVMFVVTFVAFFGKNLIVSILMLTAAFAWQYYMTNKKNIKMKEIVLNYVENKDK